MMKKNVASIFEKWLVFSAVFLGMLLSLAVPNAQAASSEWQDIGGGKVRLVANLDPVDNVISGIVEVKLDQGWSTYWRHPGSFGIPPIFNFSNSKAVKVSRVSFPTPRLIEQEYGAYAGYKGAVHFPFEAELLSTADGNINLDLLIGVCEKICIPAKAEMEIKVSDLFQSDPSAVQAISFAKLSIPKVVDEEEAIVSMQTDGTESLLIEVKHNESLGTPSLFAEGPREWNLTPAKFISHNDGIATFALDITNASTDLETLSKELKFTLATGNRGIEIKR